MRQPFFVDKLILVAYSANQQLAPEINQEEK